MRVIIPLILITMLIFIPCQTQQNPIYRASEGKIGIGSWFYYNNTVNNNVIKYINYTITGMDQIHVSYEIVKYSTSGKTWTSKTVDLSNKKICDFWTNITWYANYLREINQSSPTTEITVRTQIFYINSSYIHFRINSTSALKHKMDEEIIKINDYGVIAYQLVNITILSGSINQTRVSISQLLSYKYQNIQNEPEQEQSRFGWELISIASLVVIGTVATIWLIRSRKN